MVGVYQEAEILPVSLMTLEKVFKVPPGTGLSSICIKDTGWRFSSFL